MIELCDACGAAQRPGEACACGGATAAQASLALDRDRDRDPARDRRIAMPPLAVRTPPPRLVAVGPASGTLRLLAIGAVVLLLGAAIWALVRRLERWSQNAVDESATRPYPAPNRLVIAAVTSDYGSEALADGSILLRKLPTGPAAGLAGFYGARSNPARVDGVLDKALARMPGASPGDHARSATRQGTAHRWPLCSMVALLRVARRGRGPARGRDLLDAAPQ